MFYRGKMNAFSQDVFYGEGSWTTYADWLIFSFKQG